MSKTSQSLHAWIQSTLACWKSPQQTIEEHPCPKLKEQQQLPTPKLMQTLPHDVLLQIIDSLPEIDQIRFAMTSSSHFQLMITHYARPHPQLPNPRPSAPPSPGPSTWSHAKSLWQGWTSQAKVDHHMAHNRRITTQITSYRSLFAHGFFKNSNDVSCMPLAQTTSFQTVFPCAPRQRIPEQRGFPLLAGQSLGEHIQTLALCHQDDKVEILHFKTSEQRRRETFRVRGLIEYITISPKGQWLAIKEDSHRLSIWSLTQPNATPLRIEPHGRYLDTYSFHPQDHQIIVIEPEGQATIYPLPLQPHAPRHRIQCAQPQHNFLQAIFSPQGKVIATSSTHGEIAIRSAIYPYPLLHQWQHHMGRVHCMAFHPQETVLAIGCQNGFIQLFYCNKTYEAPKRLRHHRDCLINIIYSPNGRWFTTTSFDGTACLISSQHPEQVALSIRHDGSPMLNALFNAASNKWLTMSLFQTQLHDFS